MKADFQKLSAKSITNSFIDFWVRAEAFGFHWHYHSELEICYVKEGRGKRIIGESIEDFEDGDLVLVGSNVPHSWISDDLFNQSERDMEVYVIQFEKEVFDRFVHLPEFDAIQQLLKDAARGIYFKNAAETGLVEELHDIHSAQGLPKLLQLMALLDRFCRHDAIQFLSSSNYKVGFHKHQEERILKVCNYIHENYKNPLKISDLADLAAMNNAAFCRFFKRTLGKTVVEYVTELRISAVCQQIQNTGTPIYQIAYDTGFASIAHFNKQFKKCMGRTPTEYRLLVN